MTNADYVIIEVNMLWCDGMIPYAFCSRLLPVIFHYMRLAIAAEDSYVFKDYLLNRISECYFASCHIAGIALLL